MFSNRLAFGVLALACVAAAAGGGYLGTRHATSSPEAAAPAPPAQSLGGTVAQTPSTAQVGTETLAATLTSESVASDSAGGQRSQVESVRPRPRPSTGSRSVAARPVKQSGDPDRAVRTAHDGLDSHPTANQSIASTTSPEPESASSPSDTTQAPTPDRQVWPEAQAANEEPPVTPFEPTDIASFEELTVSADSVVGLSLDTAVSSDEARVEDTVEARVSRDVRVARQVAIPAGSRAIGSVTLVERGGKFKDRARLGIRFHTLVLTDGTRLPISTDAIYRYGDERGDNTARKIGGGAVAGAILGAVVGGAKGAAVGATAGAGGGTAVVMAGGRSAAAFPAGTELTARILAPVTVTVER